MDRPDSIRNPEVYLFTIANHVLYQHTLRNVPVQETSDMKGLAAAQDPEADPASQAELQYSHFGAVDELMPIPLADRPDVSAIAGRYRSEALRIEAAISGTDAEPRMITTGRFGSAQYKLECLADGIWRARSSSGSPWGGVLSSDGDGQAIHFSSFASRRLILRRIA